jgi:outer membrane protein assembly factor BamE
MHKLLITIVIFLGLLQAGCTTISEWANTLPEQASKLPIMYRPTIQQGNVITQDMVNKLKPGMSKRQVTYIMGTPGLVDSFHQDRWDYIYTVKKNTQPIEQKNLTLYFNDDQLTRIDGDYRPVAVDEMEVADKKETVVDVPDYEPENKGIVTRALESVGIVPQE